MSSSDQRCVVRVAVEADLLALLRLYSRADEGLKPEVESVSPIENSTWAAMLRAENQTTYVAEIDDEIVGAALFVKIINLGYDCRPSGVIEAMVVSAAHRRRGIARQIIEQILSDAKATGCHKIQLLTHKRHATDGAHDFYRSAGFEPEAEGFRLYLDS